MPRSHRGFTLIELLVAVAILLILLSIVLIMVNRSRAKAEDAKTMETLASIRTVATEDRLQSDTFSATFAPTGRSFQALEQLAADHGFSADAYAYHASANEFVVVFPLQGHDGYWCVDADGASKFVAGLPAAAPPYHCGNIDEDGEGEAGNTPPVITLDGPAVAYCDPLWGSFDLETGIMVSCDGTNSVFDAEDAPPPPAIGVTFYSDFDTSLQQCTIRRRYTATDSGGLTDQEERTFIFPSDYVSCYAFTGGTPMD